MKYVSYKSWCGTCIPRYYKHAICCTIKSKQARNK